MERRLILLFQRNYENDHANGKVVYSGFDVTWPDGSRVEAVLEKLCQHGVRTILGRRAVADRQLVELIIRHLPNRDAPLPPSRQGVRSRRLFLSRHGETGTIHFLNGVATDISFQLGRDDPRVLHWVGLSDLEDGGCRWLDLLARTLGAPSTAMANTQQVFPGVR